jgi:FkbM family methyltransferase
MVDMMSHLPTSSKGGYVRLSPFRHGNARVFLSLRSDSYIGQAIERYGEYSEAEVDVFRYFIGADDIVMDAGALFGEHTIALAELCPRGSVLAFEPQRIPFQILCANAQINSMSNIDAVKCALGAVDGISKVPSYDPRSDSPFGLARLGSPYEVGQLVRVRTIDSLALGRLDFIKIDVEGYEAQVLEGGVETIARCRPVIYLEYNENRDGIVRLLRGLGYKALYRHLAPVQRWPNYKSITLPDVLPPASDMVLAVPSRWHRPPAPFFLAVSGFEQLAGDV